MADGELVLTTSVDVGPLQAGMQQAAAAVKSSTGDMAADLAQMSAQARIQAQSLREAYRLFGDAAAAGDQEAIDSLGEQETALASTRASVMALRDEFNSLIRVQEEQAALSTKPPGATTGSRTSDGETGAGTGSDAMAALAATQTSVTEATTQLNEAQQALSLTIENGAAAALALSESLAVLGQQEIARIGALEASRGLEALASQEARNHAAAEAQLAAETSAANESAMFSAEAWTQAFLAEQDYAIASQQASTALIGETEAQLASNAAVRSGISDRQAASATLRTLEGGLTGSTRAAGTFLTSVLGLGPVLQAAFPIIGAVALGEVLITVATRVYDLYQNIVNLKGEIAALGDASDKTAKQAADANWKWVESQAELLRSQGKLTEAQQFLAAHAGQKPETLSLGLDKKVIEGLPADMQRVAESLNQVHTASGAVDVLKQVNAAIDTSRTRIGELQQLIAHPPTTTEIVHGQAITERQDVSGYQEQLTTVTEYYNSLTNLRNTNASDAAAENAKTAAQAETVAAQTNRLGQSGLEAQKQVAEARLALNEQLTRQQFEVGKISAAQEISQLGEDARKKLQIQINYLSQLDAILAKDPSKNAAELTRNAGQIQSLEVQQKTVTIRTTQDAREAEVKSALKGIDEEIAATKQGSAARIQLLQIEVAFAAAAWGESSAEYSHYIEELNTADREREAQYQKSLQKQIDETEKATEKMASDAEKAAERAYTAQQKSLDDLEKQNVQADVPQRRSRGRASGPLNLSTVEADAAAAKSAIDNWVADSEGAVNRLGQAVQDSLTVKLEAAKTALTETEANGGDSERYLAQIEELNDQVTANAQATQDKIDAVERKGADDRIAEERRVAQEKQQIDDQILNYTESITQSLLTRQRTAAETLLKTWEKVLTDLESYFTRTFERAIIESKQGQAAIGAISGGVSKVTSALGLGAAVKPGAGSGEMTSFNLALVKATPAIAALATAARAAASAENAEAPASRSVAVAKAAEAPAVTQATAAQVVQAPAVHASTAAHAVHAPTVGASTVAHVINAGATTTDATSSVVHTGAVNADTLATIAHKIAQFFGFAEGGEIRGAGSPRSDSVPIMASPGEFMVNADAVSKPGMLAHLHAINSGRRELSRLHFADGGFVTAANLNDIAPTAPALALHIQNMNAAASERSSQARFDPAEMAGDRTAPRGGGDEGNDQHNLNLHYHDRRSLSAVDTHGLHDLMGKDPRQASNLFKGLLRSGHLTMKDLLK